MATETQASPSTATATHAVVHYEIPAADAGKLVAFYSSVFGWKFGGAPGMDTYQTADTGTGDDSVTVAIYPREGEGRPTNYVRVESVAAYAERIQAHGGTVLHRFTVPRMGHGAIALDPERNPIGIWQNDPTARPE
jgi:predicted enzyme related to lactoylglutathione lyase